MADQPPTDPPARPDPKHPMPRWVKVSVAVAIVILVLAFLALVGNGLGGHGPARHLKAGAPIQGEPHVDLSQSPHVVRP